MPRPARLQDAAAMTDRTARILAFIVTYQEFHAVQAGNPDLSCP
jgi:hypothetical protein